MPGSFRTVAGAAMLAAALMLPASAQSLGPGLPDVDHLRPPARAHVSLATIPNLSAVKQQIADYYDSGSYDADVGTVMAAVQRWVAAHQAGVARPAVVLDVDETAVSNYEWLESRDFSLQEPAFEEWVRQASAPAVAAVANFYRWAQSHGIAVFFISGRLESERADTVKMLHHASYDDWAGLILKPPEYDKSSVTPFKAEARKKLMAQGWTILANVGSQQSGLDGGYALKAFKLPNPLYRVP